MTLVTAQLVAGFLLLAVACGLPISGAVPSPTPAPQPTMNWDNIVGPDVRLPAVTVIPPTLVQSALPSNSAVSTPQAPAATETPPASTGSARLVTVQVPPAGWPGRELAGAPATRYKDGLIEAALRDSRPLSLLRHHRGLNGYPI
jgi:hypothetical protein